MTRIGSFTAGALLVCVSTLLPRDARAQLTPAGAAFLGTGQNGIALGRGFEAPGLSPANLALSDNPSLSLTLFSSGVQSGLGPVTFGDMSAYGTDPVPAQVRETWLQSITADGSQTGAGGIDLALLGLSVGPFALQLSTAGRAHAFLDPDGAEALMFGNYGRTGEPAELEPLGTVVDVFVYSTAALSYGYRIPFDPAFFREGERLALGVTAKATVGHDMVVVRDAGSVITSGPITADIQLPSVETRADAGRFDGGIGFGADLGVAYETGPIVVSAVGRNLIHTFQWDTASLVYRPNTIFFTPSATVAEFDAQAVQQAPAALLSIVEELGFEREIEVGAALRAGERLRVAGAFRHRLGDGMDFSPATHVGLGAEFQLLPYLPIRAGIASVTGGFQAGSGLALEWGPVGVSGAFLYRSADGFEGAVGSLALSYRAR